MTIFLRGSFSFACGVPISTHLKAPAACLKGHGLPPRHTTFKAQVCIIGQATTVIDICVIHLFDI